MTYIDTWPDSDWPKKKKAPIISAAQPLEFYSPDQDRDERGRFGNGPGEAPSATLTAAAKAYQGDKEETQMVRYAADRLVLGERNADQDGTDRARELLHAIEKSSPTTMGLYRGIVADHPSYVAGQSIQFAIGSFSESKSWAEGFALGAGFMTGTVKTSTMEAPAPVLFTLEPGARALSVDALTMPNEKHVEREWITGGKFQVVSVEPYGPIGSKLLGTSDGQHVTLRQTEVVSIP